jgi:hypothetical protein
MQFIGASPGVVHTLEQSWLQAEYERSRSEVLNRYPTLTIESEGAIAGSAPGLRGDYSHGASRSELLLFIEDQTWFVKHRHTYPASCAQAASSALVNFHQGLRQ